MSADSRARQSPAAVVARAAALAAADSGGQRDPDADVLIALAAGEATAADVDDETLDRLVQAFGTDAVVQAVRAAPAGRRVGNRSAVAGQVPVPVREAAPAAVGKPARVVAMPPRRAAFWRRWPAWQAAAASVAAVAVAAALFTDRWRSVPPPGVPDGVAQRGAIPRGQPATSEPPLSPAPDIGVRDRLVVLIRSDDQAGAAAAEGVLARSVSGAAALAALDAAGVAALRRDDAARQAAEAGDFAALAAAGRARGADVLVVGALRVSPPLASGGGYASAAELRILVHRASTQRTSDGQTFVSSTMPSTRAPAPTEAEARVRAAQDAAAQAAAVVGTWLARDGR